MTLLTPILCALLAADAPSTATTAHVEKDERDKTEVMVALSGGLRPDSLSGGGAGWLGLTHPLGRIFRLEIDLGLGTYPTTSDLLTLIRIGTRIEYPRDGVVPYLFVALAHDHEAKFASVLQNPIPTVLGLSEDGVVHRTGVDAGVGIFGNLMKPGPGQLQGRAGLRLSITHLLGAGPPRYVDLIGTFGVLF